MRHMIVINSMSCIYNFSDNIHAIFDIWFIGDDCMKNSFGTFEAMTRVQQGDRKKIPPYIYENYNTLPFYKSFSSGVTSTAAHMINTLIEALNTREWLPRFVVVIPDKDLLKDIEVYEFAASKVIQDLVAWTIRQMNMLIRRKCAALLEKCPGAVFGDTKVILVRMMRRYWKYERDSKIDRVLSLRAKCNDALNEAAIKNDLHILTIDSCNSADHFDQHGNLSTKGKNAFWYEMDELLERFDKGGIKLLPAPRQKFWSSKQPMSASHWDTSHSRRPLPAPPGSTSYRGYLKF